jgi:gamma-glutamyltranspeptidase/glutathione hydrolase
MVATTHWIASAAGMSILELGGNAFDAAVAAGITLQVVEPHLNGPAGEVPIIFHDAASQDTHVICGQGVAPAGASIEAFESLGIDMIPPTGVLSSAVPGAFDAWMLMFRDHGTMSLQDVMAPAISYAEHGYPIVAKISEAIAAVEELFLKHWTSSAAVYLKNGTHPLPGTLLRNVALAKTYQRIVDEAAAFTDRIQQIEAARNCWKTGFVAEAIDTFCNTQLVFDSTGAEHKSLLSGDDLAGWSATYETPVTFDYENVTIAKTGPWGQGPVLLQQLALLKGFDLELMDPLGADFVHTVTECAKLGFADREAYYADPMFENVPLTTLLSDEYNSQRRSLVEHGASHELRPGSIGGRTPFIPTSRVPDDGCSAVGAGEPTIGNLGETKGDTCHLDIVDRHGNMVSATPSGGWLQSSPIIPSLGFALGTRLQMFWLDKRCPNHLMPGKRPRTTLTPGLALRDGLPYLAFGTPGGDQQDQWSLLFLLRHLHFGYNLQEAIDAPMFNTDHFPSSFWPRQSNPGHLYVERRFSADTINELEARGHRVTVEGDWALGRLAAASQEIQDGQRLLKAAASPRHMQNYAVGR